MKIARVWLVVLLAAAGGARAQVQEARPSGPFNGRWVVRADNGDGTFRETVFVLEQRGAALNRCGSL